LTFRSAQRIQAKVGLLGTLEEGEEDIVAMASNEYSGEADNGA
jgi:hypothetical protein